MHYVYILKSEITRKSYTGSTKNLRSRIKKHNSGEVTHTAKYKPWKIQSYFAFENKDIAIKFEKYLKSNSGRAFASKHF